VGRKLYVGNLPFTCTDDTLASHFGQVGQVESAKIIMDRVSGRSKGFGFVEMATDQEAADAIGRLNGAEFSGRPLTVSEARPQAPRENGGGGGGGFRGGRDSGNRW